MDQQHSWDIVTLVHQQGFHNAPRITSDSQHHIQTNIKTTILTLEQMVSITVVTLGWENVRKVAAPTVPVAKH